MEEKETYWSRFAADFEERNNYIIGKENMDIVLNEISKEKNLGETLELACGNGTYSKVLSKNATTLICTDFSDEMVEASTQRLQDFKNIKVEKANCFALPYEDNSFDTIFMANLLHIIPTPEKAVAEAKRVLKPNGQIIALSFTVTGMSFLSKMGMIYRYLKSYGKPPKTGSHIDDKSLKLLFEQNDLAVVYSTIIGGSSKAAFGKAKKKI